LWPKKINDIIKLINNYAQGGNMNNKLIGTEKNIIFYNDEEGNIKIEVLLENEDVWLNTEAIVF
jgi:hypothetical protein